MTVDTAAAQRSAANTHIAVMRINAEYRLAMTRHVCAGAKLFDINGDLTQKPTRYSVQVGPTAHVDLPDGCAHEEVLDRYFWRFMNHSCRPNSIVRGREVIARTCIDPWHEVRFDYNTTEYDMAEPFDCHCGTVGCTGRISGFRWLPQAARERLRPWLAPHLLAILDSDHTSVSATATAAGHS
jgi:hypothetical protein